MTTVGEDLHRLEIHPVETWAAAAADRVAGIIDRVVGRNGRCLLAVDGSDDLLPALRALAGLDLAWDRVVLIPTHEAVATVCSGHRLLPGLRRVFDGLPVAWLPLPVEQVAVADDVEAVDSVLDRFDLRLLDLAGTPPVLDVCLVGVGVDGSVAGLIPWDRALGELRRYSAVTGQDTTRWITLTRPVFDRSRAVVWLVPGQDRTRPLGRILMGDLSLPAGTIRPRQSLVLADSDAARQV